VEIRVSVENEAAISRGKPHDSSGKTPDSDNCFSVLRRKDPADHPKKYAAHHSDSRADEKSADP
jgi:hypothetical protein